MEGRNVQGDVGTDGRASAVQYSAIQMSIGIKV